MPGVKFFKFRMNSFRGALIIALLAAPPLPALAARGEAVSIVFGRGTGIAPGTRMRGMLTGCDKAGVAFAVRGRGRFYVKWAHLRRVNGRRPIPRAREALCAPRRANASPEGPEGARPLAWTAPRAG